MEKFAVKKTERYFAQQRQLTLPCIELMYLWNTFKILGKHFTLGDNILKLIDKALNDMDAKSNSSKYDGDNRALLLLLKGACLRQMKSPMLSLKYYLL